MSHPKFSSVFCVILSTVVDTGPVEQAKDLSDAEVAAQLQAELDRSK